ncbi:GTPase IMAP family member 4-like, partial [Engraulis encrasicolus]|uniref:GTPase IMAP family member 4-like n=1 Tax=Engraulis encrasicolus TaxID=184585 RepID=UPI002FD52186
MVQKHTWSECTGGGGASGRNAQEAAWVQPEYSETGEPLDTSTATHTMPYKNQMKRPIVKVILLGLCGSGKSTSGNNILGKKVFRSNSGSKATTIQCEEFSMVFNGTELKVIDTPDFFDEDLQDPSTHVQECRDMCKGLVCVYLLVIQIGRYTVGEGDIIERLEAVLQTSIRDRAIILFTRGDDLGSQTIEEYVVKTNRHLQKLIRQCDDRYQVFNNKDKKVVKQQVKGLMGMIKGLVKETDNMDIFTQAESIIQMYC